MHSVTPPSRRVFSRLERPFSPAQLSSVLLPNTSLLHDVLQSLPLFVRDQAHESEPDVFDRVVLVQQADVAGQDGFGVVDLELELGVEWRDGLGRDWGDGCEGGERAGQAALGVVDGIMEGGELGLQFLVVRIGGGGG